MLGIGHTLRVKLLQVRRKVRYPLCIEKLCKREAQRL